MLRRGSAREPYTMPVASEGACQSRYNDRVQHLTKLVQEALSLSDELGDRPDVGARLQEILETLEDDARP